MNSTNTVVIDISDSGILISNGNKILIDSPSCALINSDYSITIGQQALEQAHLRPLDISTNYWAQLTQNSTTKNIVSNTELAYRHLTLAWEQLNFETVDAIVTVPNTFSKQDLGLLLGICNKLSISIFALLSNTVLTLSNRLPKCKVIHLDIMQQKIVFNELDHDDISISARQVNKVLPYGLEKLNDNIAKNIAKKFIQETRYDPIHSAEDEQYFFNALPQWLTYLQHADSIECKLESNSHSYNINLTKDDIAEVNQLAFNEIALSLSALLPSDTENILIICSPSSEKLFKLIEFLKTLPGCAIEILDNISLSKQAMLLKDTILLKQAQVLYTTSLNLHGNLKDAQISFNSKSLRHLDSIPTHVLFNHIAYSLTEETYINFDDSSLNISASNSEGKASICKISNSGYLKEIIKLDSVNISIDNTEINESHLVSIGDRLKIDNCESEIIFIKVNRYEA